MRTDMGLPERGMESIEQVRFENGEHLRNQRLLGGRPEIFRQEAEAFEHWLNVGALEQDVAGKDDSMPCDCYWRMCSIVSGGPARP